MRREYGISRGIPDENIFKSGLFSCIEYCKSSMPEADSFEKIEREAGELKALSEKYGVKIRSFHLPFSDSGAYPFSPADIDEEKRIKTLEYTKKLVNIVKECGVEMLVIHGSLKVLPEERQRRLDIFTEYLKELCDFCAPLGIKVAVETLKPRCLGRSLEEHLYIIEKVNRENLGICFDSNHLLTEDNIAFLEGAGQYVITTHLSDYDGLDERHWYPGRGVNNWKKIVEVLRRKGYSGPYVFEIHFPEGGDTLSESRKLINEWENLFK